MYRTIDTSIWNDPRIRKLDPIAKILAVYLITNDRTHITGLYFFSLALASDELQIDIVKMRKAFKLLCDVKFCKWDEERRVIWVVNMWKRQGKAGVHFDRLQNHFLTLNNTPLIGQFLSRYSSYNIPVTKLSLPCHDDGTNLNESAHHEQEQELEQEQDIYPTPAEPVSRKKVKVEVSHDPEEIRVEIEKVEQDLPRIREKFPTKDVSGVWEVFADDCLTGGSKHTTPNPYKYTDFKKGFYTYLRNSRDTEQPRGSPNSPRGQKFDPKTVKLE